MKVFHSYPCLILLIALAAAPCSYAKQLKTPEEPFNVLFPELKFAPCSTVASMSLEKCEATKSFMMLATSRLLKLKNFQEIPAATMLPDIHTEFKAYNFPKYKGYFSYEADAILKCVENDCGDVMLHPEKSRKILSERYRSSFLFYRCVLRKVVKPPLSNDSSFRGPRYTYLYYFNARNGHEVVKCPLSQEIDRIKAFTLHKFPVSGMKSTF